MALEMLMGFADGYLTVADNFFVYQTAPNSPKFVFILWDIDLILGSTALSSFRKWRRVIGENLQVL